MTKMLAPREIEVASLIAQGYRSHTIAEKLNLSQNTTRHYARVIRKKTLCKSNLKVAVYWNCELFQIGLEELGIRRRL